FKGALLNVLRGQNRLVLGGSLHWIFHRSCFYRNSIFAKTLHAALLINDKSRSKLVRNIIPRYMKDICISGGI
ncbi:hypothetical protein POZ08_03925, partial [Bacteroides uniformis]|uniref:hypothetical protein n=1 Tax=Bacteroides uniformis TaxID=820 RepID=UPI001E45CB74